METHCEQGINQPILKGYWGYEPKERGTLRGYEISTDWSRITPKDENWRKSFYPHQKDISKNAKKILLNTAEKPEFPYAATLSAVATLGAAAGLVYAYSRLDDILKYIIN